MEKIYINNKINKLKVETLNFLNDGSFEKKFIIVLGEFGSGKSYFVNFLVNDSEYQIINTDENGEICRGFRDESKVVNLSGFNTSDEALLMLPFKSEKCLTVSFIILLITLSLMFRFFFQIEIQPGIPKMASDLMIFVCTIVVAFLSYLTATNKYGLAFDYLFNIVFSANKLYVIEDIERSNLNISDLLNIFHHLKDVNGRFLVTLGFSTFEEKIKYFELAGKINAKILELPENNASKLKFMMDIEPDFPFAVGHLNDNFSYLSWLSLFGYRDLSLIREEVNIFCTIHNDEELKVIFYLRTIVEKIFFKLNYSLEDLEKFYYHEIDYLTLKSTGDRAYVNLPESDKIILKNLFVCFKYEINIAVPNFPNILIHFTDKKLLIQDLIILKSLFKPKLNVNP
ncbi:MAG: hypothetical protein U0T83_10315 [Bacteriovoracaceae bacterium]